MQIKEAMTRDPQCVWPDTSVREAAAKMRELDVGSLLVCGPDGKLAGLVTDRDIVVRCVATGADTGKARVADAMTPDIAYCFEDEDMSVAQERMRKEQIRRLAVLDRAKQLVGILSLGDVATRDRDAAQAGETLSGVSS